MTLSARRATLPNSLSSTPTPDQNQRIGSRLSEGFALFLISLLILFLELATIRWFPAHVLFLTFFTNTMLLACFLGMSIGCLAANHRRRYLVWTPILLAIAMAAAHAIEASSGSFAKFVDVGHQSSPQLVFFGTGITPLTCLATRFPSRLSAVSFSL
jgi:hypothetical protein